MADVYTSEMGAILNQLVDLDEILYGGDDIESDLDAIFFNLLASNISKCDRLNF
jgi:hypothetical protein